MIADCSQDGQRVRASLQIFHFVQVAQRHVVIQAPRCEEMDRVVPIARTTEALAQPVQEVRGIARCNTPHAHSWDLIRRTPENVEALHLDDQEKVAQALCSNSHVCRRADFLRVAQRVRLHDPAHHHSFD